MVPGMVGVKLLIVQPLDEARQPKGRPVVAADAVHMAGPGELVYYVSSREAAEALDPRFLDVPGEQDRQVPALHAEHRGLVVSGPRKRPRGGEDLHPGPGNVQSGPRGDRPGRGLVLDRKEVSTMGSDDRLDAAKLISPGVITVSFWTVAVVLWRAMGNIFLLYNFISQLPGDLFETASIDGATHYQMFTRIVLPLSVPAITQLPVSCFRSK